MTSEEVRSLRLNLLDLFEEMLWKVLICRDRWQGSTCRESTCWESTCSEVWLPDMPVEAHLRNINIYCIHPHLNPSTYTVERWLWDHFPTQHPSFLGDTILPTNIDPADWGVVGYFALEICYSQIISGELVGGMGIAGTIPVTPLSTTIVPTNNSNAPIKPQ